MRSDLVAAYSLLDNHLINLSYHPESYSPAFFNWDGLILSTRSRYDNIRKVLRLDDLFQCRTAADHQRRTLQLHQLFLLELGE
jgi:hypothetical protein